ncbi:uncharacterized protein LOC131308546 isoform X1 [Rhododendron vialii]|uniref:uncharacterized protein LOC131308546 isoform X1 n=1 Tax=Rhododendron vialii TaxID=182163 RepID=UPI00265EE1C6|nr:uncharacterized protein LOC131308546 isoform X1 [Rhododendron vialii]
MKKKRCGIHLVLLGFLLCLPMRIQGESSTCLMVYREGGALAVFQSPKCPRWKLSDYSASPPTARCQSATHQGLRKSQEDRTLCVLDLRIPFPGPSGLTEVIVGIMAVFDGHNGAEASEMASKLLLEYFVLHTYFLLDSTFLFISKRSVGMLPDNEEPYLTFQAINWEDVGNWHASDHERFKLTSSAIFSGSFHLEILKESLLRAIHDIDVAFSKEASRDNLDSGSTATVILLADGKILVANVGDSKALLCSEEFQSPSEAKATLLRLYRQRRRDGAISPIKFNNGFQLAASNGLPHFCAKELTSDHHPDRDDERYRVESAGGHVEEWAGVSRVNGQLAVSRAIGDIFFKRYGVISSPEVTDWQSLTPNDSYLVAASDGIFEKLSPQDVCDLFWDVDNHGTVMSELAASCSYSLADCIVDSASEKGSMDNMAVVVVPLKSTVFSQSSMKEQLHGVGKFDQLAFGVQKFIGEESELEHVHPVVAKFDRLLVGKKHGTVGHFYLSENLNEDVDHTFWVQKADQHHKYDLPQALPEPHDYHYSGPLNLYNYQNMCLHYGMTVNEDTGKCLNPDGFAGFLGLLESIPMHNMGSEYGSAEHAMPDLRYILKKRYGRGAFGEVWLAFYWNGTDGSNASNWGQHNTRGFNTLHFDTYGRNSQTNSSARDFNRGAPEDNLFILKRIMVERGTSVYLSGLREKYFGEVFLNASTFIGSLPSAKLSESVLKESQPDFSELPKTNESVAHETGDAWNLDNISQYRNRLQRVTYEEGLNHIARYVESFESRSNEIWLVFRHEGVSLSKILYTAEKVGNSTDDERDEHAKHVQILRPSKWWHWLKTTEAGQEEMRNLIWQLLMALKSCHERNITHRDVKPENMVICFEDQDSGRCLIGIPSKDMRYTTKMRMIDFGSAMDMFTMKLLYGSVGPSRSEQTYEYTPPEALLNSSWYQGPMQTILKYDMWSAGVVFLELILGSPDVFQISALTSALLDQHLEGWNEGLKELAHKLRAFMELCILMPVSSSKKYHVSGMKGGGANSPASWKCSEEYFSQQIKNRDPLKIGFPNVWALRLVRQLLVWDPDERLSVDEALQHPYFQTNLQG